MDKETEDAIKAVADSVKVLADGQSALQGSIGQLTNSMSQNLQASNQQHNDNTPEPFNMPGAEELEAMDRTALVNVIASKVTSDLDAKLNPLTQAISKLDQGISTQASKTEFQQVSSKYPDFLKWKDEIVASVNATPGLSLEKAYKLARLEDPEKATQVDKEFKLGDFANAPDDDSKEGTGNDNSQLRLHKDKDGKFSFGGLQPSGDDVPGEKDTTPNEGSMDLNDAFDDAFDKSLAAVPGAGQYVGGSSALE